MERQIVVGEVAAFGTCGKRHGQLSSAKFPHIAGMTRTAIALFSAGDVTALAKRNLRMIQMFLVEHWWLSVCH